MNAEQVVSEWLRSVAPPQAPERDRLLAATIARVAATRQDAVRPWLHRLGHPRPRTRLLLVAAVVAGTVLLGSILVGSLRTRLTTPSVRLGSLAYVVDDSVFIVGTEREPAPAVEIATNGAHGLRYWAPRWSPDGRYLMYAGAPIGDGQSTIFVVDPQGRVVSSFPGWLASWSPDSSRIAAWDDPFKTVGIWSVDGQRIATVAFPDGVTLPGDSTPTFTGDGQALYFVLSRVSSEPKAVPIDGSAPYELSPIRTAGDPVFSSDGSQIALPATDGLWVAQADGSAARLVAHPAAGRYDDAVWSRTDARIAVAWTGADQYESLAVVDIGSGRTAIVWESASGDRIHAIRWAPDDGSILMSSGPRLYRVAVTEAQTSNPTFSAQLLLEDPSHDPSVDLDADWQWITDGN
jgi:WD40 repeat protein